MTLFFISIGLSDEKDMSIKAVGAARSCDRLFAELYTSKLETDKARLSEFLGKEVVLLQRKDLEEDYRKLLDEAVDKKVGLLVGGDCFVSTAHTALMAEARKRGIDVKVIHGSSIVSAVCEAGLHMPKFGQMVTIPFPDRTKGKLAGSVYDVILGNKKRGLHTLCLLDMVAEEGRFMKVGEAIGILLVLEKEFRKKIIGMKTDAVVFSRLGSESQKIAYGKLEELFRMGFEEPPHAMIIVGKLHFSEKAVLEKQMLG